jgi:hypothetical protein
MVYRIWLFFQFHHLLIFYLINLVLILLIDVYFVLDSF